VTANEDLFDIHVQHQIDLEAFTEQELRKTLGFLNEMDQDIEKQILGRRNRGLDPANFTAERLRRLSASIKKLHADAFEKLDRVLRGDMRALAFDERNFEMDAMRAVSPVQIDVVTPPAARIRAIVNTQPMRGKFIKDWVGDLSALSVDRMNTAIRLGVGEGETLDQIVRRIRGTRALNFRDGAANITRRNAETIVRTAVNDISNRARGEVFKANADIIKGLRWTATLDSRTSPVCRGRDGIVFPVDSGPRPPAHPQCRSVMVAVMDGVKIAGDRASEFGPVPASTTYGEWLRGQEKKRGRPFVENILGKKKAALFLDGKLPLSKFVNPRGRELTLEQLRNSNSKTVKMAFNSAFGVKPKPGKSQLTGAAALKARRDRLNQGVINAFAEGGLDSKRLGLAPGESLSQSVIDTEMLIAQKKYESELIEMKRWLQTGKQSFETSPFTAEGEMVAMKAYTGSFYRRVNSGLRSGSPTAPVKSYAEAMNAGMDTLPTVQGSVWRGTWLAPAQIETYVDNIGKVITEKGFVSATTDARVAREFNENAFYSIRSKTGRRFDSFSHLAEEKEVVFKSGTQFRVVSVNTAPGELGNFVIFLEEI
jgi:SPP1 gp7 family putative phage head morphogenesis protein